MTETDCMDLKGEVKPPPISERNAVLGDESYFRLLDAVSTPILLHRVGHVIYANTAYQLLVGYSRDELLALPFYEIGYGEWKQILRERGEARMRGENVPNVYEFRLETKHGGERWAELNASRILLGDLPTVFCSLVDLTDRKRVAAVQRNLQQLMAQIIDSDPLATFVVNAQHKVTHWNRACVTLTGMPSEQVIGTNLQWKPFYPEERDTLADLLITGATEDQVIAHYPEANVRPSSLAPGAYEGEGFVSQFGESGRWIFFTAALLHDSKGRVIGAIQKIQDQTERWRAQEELRQYQAGLEQLVETRTAQLGDANRRLQEDIAHRQAVEAELRTRNVELTELNARLSQAQAQLLQSEKLASIGQLAAGVAHEINNPIGYVYSNIGTLENYLNDLLKMLGAYEEVRPALPADQAGSLGNLHAQIDIDFLKEDIPSLMRESKEGITRVKQIVQNLQDFSRVENSEGWQMANLHQCIESTLNIASNGIKYKADVVKEYGALPEVECIPSQLNQVFLNLLVNAVQSLGEDRGKITICTGVVDETVWLEFSDTGCGMSEEIQRKIFDPFFTTKAVGKGTGLGLSLSYGIIQKHHGAISVESAVGKGSTFRITLPVRRAESANK
ncbi:MAG: PAS domain S-box protein [Betaproteobacteria bacterium]